MNKSAVYILNFEDLYNIIYEIKNFFNFDLFNSEDVKWIIDNVTTSQYTSERCYIYNKAFAKYFLIKPIT